jgi:hypothetical protein
VILQKEATHVGKIHVHCIGWFGTSRYRGLCTDTFIHPEYDGSRRHDIFGTG